MSAVDEQDREQVGMRRWNGWGEEGVSYPWPDSAAGYLDGLLGQGEAVPDVSIETVLGSVPQTRLSDHPLIDLDPVGRLSHARGQSLPDWIALRYGRVSQFPDGVAHPESHEAVRQLLIYARRNGVDVIPYGGGTSVVGHINPQPESRPALTLDMKRLNRLEHLDEESGLATFGAGATGPGLENQLQTHGLTLGHYPQSFEYSTLGGWIATRSSGQQSYYYGRIEDMFAGGSLETPAGPMDILPLPASAAGPDLRQLVLGSEGRLGILSRATVRVRPLPAHEGFFAAFFHDWPSGVAAVREMAQTGLPVSMLRLSDAQESETTLALAGRERLVAWADRGLRWLKYGTGRCLLIYSLSGDQTTVKMAHRQVKTIARSHGGLPVGGLIGRIWRKNRFLSPYLRNTLWEKGYAVDTLETAIRWSQVPTMASAILGALRSALEPEGERVLAFAHLSHVYRDGASIYVTTLFRRTADPDQTLARWHCLKSRASKVIVTQGGTISHQHGIGQDHASYLAAEKGELGMDWLEAVRRAADPDGIMNPGKLLA